MSFSPQSRVWVYQSNRKFTDAEATAIQQQLTAFTDSWQAHGKPLQAKALMPYHFFIVFVVDEHDVAATGCSIDASVKVLKEIETTYGVDLFDRFNMAYKLDDEIHVVSKEDFETLITAKQITADTIVFNNMVQTLEEFEQKWELPIAESWHKSIFAEQLNA